MHDDDLDYLTQREQDSRDAAADATDPAARAAHLALAEGYRRRREAAAQETRQPA